MARLLRGESVSVQQASTIFRQLVDWVGNLSDRERDQAYRKAMFAYHVAFFCDVDKDDYLYVHQPYRPELRALTEKLHLKALRAGHPSAQCIATLIGYLRPSGSATPTADDIRNVLDGRDPPDPDLLDDLVTALDAWRAEPTGVDERARLVAILQTAWSEINGAPTTTIFSHAELLEMVNAAEATSDFVSGLFASRDVDVTTSGRPVVRSIDAHCVGVIRGSLSGAVMLLSDGHSLTVGRGHLNDVTLVHTTVSRRHCRLMARDRQLFVVDNWSTNGTFVDDCLVTAEYPVRIGAKIRLGAILLAYIGIVTIQAGQHVNAVADDVRQRIRQIGLLD